jgi:hypothetical protein
MTDVEDISTQLKLKICIGCGLLNNASFYIIEEIPNMSGASVSIRKTKIFLNNGRCGDYYVSENGKIEKK